jgi:signal transduction histidine kinase/ActR/RegA family two-component response regulator
MERLTVDASVFLNMSFPREYMRAALLVSLLSIWVLVFLFYYLNRYTKRPYFTTWTAAWLFYALWLTLGLSAPNPDPTSLRMIARQWCVGISAVFLLWGSLDFLEIKVRQRLFGLFMGFLLTWSTISPQVTSDPILIQTPLFLLIGMSSIFAGVSFYRLRKRRQFVGVGLLFFGFFLWGVYLATYPLTLKHENLFSAGFLVSAVLQLFIAVSMIVLVLEEARHINEQTQKLVADVNSEKEALQIRILNVEEKYRSLFDQTRSSDDLQKAYNDLRQTQQSVVQQERLRALGQMASGIAHDINNALSPVLAYADLVLRKEPGISAGSRKNLEHVKTAAEDIAHIVERMSEFYRRREHNTHLRLVNLNRVVEQVLDLTRPRWHDMAQSQGIAIKVETVLDESLPELYANESELRETLTNLVLNSVDAMPKGGVITLALRSHSLTTEFFSESVPSHIIVEVQDTGIGMDEKTRQRCLEPFFSTKRDRGGSGLGLAMVYGMMERHEGTIEIDSAVGKGTTMRLVFPVRQPPAKASPTSHTSRAAERPLRVLCVDDEPLLRELLKELLEFHRHTVVTADGGQAGLDAFQAARNSGEPFDAVVTDLGMPMVDGRKVALTIKTTSPSTPVVMLTGWGTMLNEKGDLPINVDAILSKPPRPAELHETIVKVVTSSLKKQAA